MLANIERRLSRQYWLGVLPSVVVLTYRDFVPRYLTDDPVRVVSLRRVCDPSFLSHEWLQLAGYDEDRLTLLFKFLFAPLWGVFRSGIPVVLCARLIVWSLVLFAIARLAQAIRVPRYALAIGLCYWIDQGQSMGVGEWILGGAEGKCLAYVTLILALESLIQGKLVRSAAFCGLAFWFHVPVAVWGVLAVYGAMLFSKKVHGIGELFKPFLTTLTLSCPMAWIAWKYASLAPPNGGYPGTDWLIVVFRNPHHLDPEYFGGWHIIVRLLVCAALANMALKRSFEPRVRTILNAFMIVLLLEFTFGLIARQLSLFWYLKTYPFRVCDVVIFLLCCIVLPKFVVDVFSNTGGQDYPSLNRRNFRIAGTLLMVLVFAKCTLSIGLARSDKFFVKQFVRSWYSYLRHDTTAYDEMTKWIRSNTAVDTVIIAPPWMDDFPLEAERAPVVSFRRNPHNGLIVEWYRRYCAMNGGDFHSIGLATLAEVEGNYGKLTRAQLQSIHQLYGGEYYFTITKRSDLDAQLVHSNQSYYLYRIP